MPVDAPLIPSQNKAPIRWLPCVRLAGNGAEDRALPVGVTGNHDVCLFDVAVHRLLAVQEHDTSLTGF